MANRLTLGLFAVFLLAYFAEKYWVAAPPIFQWAYLRDVIIITTITAILPFLVMWTLRNRFASMAVHGTAMLAGCILLSALGYASYWYFTISAFPNAPPVEFLAQRGVRPGAIMAAILIFGRWWQRRKAS
jgi:hypothetical protein